MVEVGGICSHEHILVFWENEQREAANAVEIYLEGDYHDDKEHCTLVMKKHEGLPFTWMQY